MKVVATVFIAFFLCLAAVFTYFAASDVHIAQQTVTKEIPHDRLQSN